MASHHGQDRLSLLPDAILSIILSLIPLKDVVRTSVLGHQWRNLWRSRCIIEINERLFASSSAQEDHTNNEARQVSCISFGRAWLLERQNNNQSPISAFILSFSDPWIYHQDMENFIQFALSHRTKSLELDFSGWNWEGRFPISDEYEERYDLPQFVYEYDVLETLTLVSCGFRDDMLMNLGRNLRSVSLGWIEIEDTSTLMNLIQSCPLLESLSLSKCFKSTVYVIESRRLKFLVVDKCIDLLTLTINAPNLRSFKYCGSVVAFGIGPFPSLEEADLDFGLESFFDSENLDKITYVLENVRLAKSLRICAYIIQLLMEALEEDHPSRLPGPPHHSKELTIRTCFHEFEFFGILCILNSYPFLETLRFEFDEATSFEDDDMITINHSNWDPKTYWSKVEPLNGSLKKLKQVEIKGYRGTSHELGIIHFLIVHSQGPLQTLTISEVDDEGDNSAEMNATLLRNTIAEQYGDQVNVVVIT